MAASVGAPDLKLPAGIQIELKARNSSENVNNTKKSFHIIARFGIRNSRSVAE